MPIISRLVDSAKDAADKITGNDDDADKVRKAEEANAEKIANAR